MSVNEKVETEEVGKEEKCDCAICRCAGDAMDEVFEHATRETLRAGAYLDRRDDVLAAARVRLEAMREMDAELNERLIDMEMGFGLEGDDRCLLPLIAYAVEEYGRRKMEAEIAAFVKTMMAEGPAPEGEGETTPQPEEGKEAVNG